MLPDKYDWYMSTHQTLSQMEMRKLKGSSEACEDAGATTLTTHDRWKKLSVRVENEMYNTKSYSISGNGKIPA